LAIIAVFATQKLQQMLEKTLLWRIYLRDSEDFYAWRLFFNHHSAAYSANDFQQWTYCSILPYFFYFWLFRKWREDQNQN